jgi:hypothetical protein
MQRIIPVLMSFALVSMLLSAFPHAAAAQPASGQPICFPGVPGINDCIDSAFAGYWQSNGGLPVFGYPLAGLEQYTPPDGVGTVTAQWTERNRMELHPGNPPEYRVLLGRMGAERMAQLGRDPNQEPRDAGPQAGCLWFETTSQNVCNQAGNVGFRQYWEANGLRIPGLNAYQRSLALFGLPLTQARMEPGPDGQMILTQWFERARFEWHPNNADPFRVLLGRLGSEVRPNTSTQPLPAVNNNRSIFGVEIRPGWTSRVAGPLNELRPDWVRYNGIVWANVEPTPGARNWTAIERAFSEIATIAASGAEPIVIIRSTPAWAQARPNTTCGPIRPDALPAFAAFLGDLVTRLSAPPYNVRYWEFGNEPDIDATLVNPNSAFGCWGDATDRAGYGGGLYAEMLKAAYPAIKAVDPQAQVLIGGLLLDCDPTRDSTCVAGRFLDGVLAAGGGDYFDIMAYHAYTYWGNVPLDTDLAHPKWDHRGGVLLGKAQFLRETLVKYGYSKPIMMNEGGLLCFRSDPICAQNSFFVDQASYIVRLYARSWATGLVASIWYGLDGPGWQEGGLLDANQQPRPAFTALRFLSTRFANASYAGNLSNGAVEGYAFRTADREYRIYWTNSAATVPLDLPNRVLAAYSPTGTPLALADGLRASFTPIIVELRAE